MDVMQEIIDKIVSQCKKQGYDVSKPLATFIAKSVIMNQIKKLPQDAELTKHIIDELVKISVDIIIQEDSPQLETIKMQIHVENTKKEGRNRRLNEINRHEYTTKRLVQEIIKKDDSAQVFGDIVLYILHQTKLLDSSNDLIERETINALESVIPKTYINAFVKQPASEKESQIKDLWKIVWGIRLINRATNKGGAGIEPVDEILEMTLPDLQDEVNRGVIEMENVIENYQIVIKSGTIYDDERLKRLRDELTNRRQYLSFLRSIQQEIGDLAEHHVVTNHHYKQRVMELKTILEQTTSVPKAKIYPMFIELAEFWNELGAIYEKLKSIRQIMDSLLKFKHSYKLTLTDYEIDNARKEMGEERTDELSTEKKTTMDEEPSKESEAELVPASKDVHLEFGGFCPVTLLNEQRLPTPGDPNVGYVKYKGRYYSFADGECANLFLKEPQKYLKGVLDVAMESFELIHLLELQERIPNKLVYEDKHQKKRLSTFSLLPASEKKEIDIQTDVHPVESYIDPKYEWNEWNLRRQALMLANLRNKRTHSTQTYHSHFRRDAETQDYPPKHQSTQTMKDKGIQPPKQIRYISGLRGDPNAKMKVVNITFDPSEK